VGVLVADGMWQRIWRAQAGTDASCVPPSTRRRQHKGRGGRKEQMTVRICTLYSLAPCKKSIRRLYEKSVNES
jgi:hypothetical protein